METNDGHVDAPTYRLISGCDYLNLQSNDVIVQLQNNTPTTLADLTNSSISNTSACTSRASSAFDMVLTQPEILISKTLEKSQSEGSLTELRNLLLSWNLEELYDFVCKYFLHPLATLYMLI